MMIDKTGGRAVDAAKVAWAPKARRHGECAEWSEVPETAVKASEEVSLAPAAPARTNWPRVFPGI